MGEQLYKSLKLTKENVEILILLNKESRRFGLGNKIMTYKLQEEGFDIIK